MREKVTSAAATPVTVGFAGLTHAGIVGALAAAAQGARVIAFDPDMTLVARLKQGDVPVVAPVLIQSASVDYTATAADLSQCDVVFFSADVPASEKGRSDLTALQALLDDAAPAARQEAVLVISSPVPPGFSRSQTRAGRALYYLLDTLAIDEDVERANAPKRLFVGCADSSAPLPRTLQRFFELFGCPVQPMRYESAELARFGLALMRVAGDHAASLVSDLSEKVEATREEVGAVLGAAPTSAANGPGVERDLAILRRLAEKQGVDASLIESGLARVRQQQDWVLQCLDGQVLKNSPDARLAILGLASRQGTRSIDESPALALLASLPKLPVRVYDPAVSADPSWHGGLEAATDALDACRDADAVVIMTPWREFAALDLEALAGRMRGKVIIDPYRVLEPGPVRQAGLALHTPS